MTASSTDKHEQNRDTPYTEIELPKRAYDRTESMEPSCAKSNTEKDEPNRARPKMEQELDKRV
jgi:hypothetical protein